ncbi:MAG: hypothetical protein KDD13_00225 [Mangrovimonas sp.]|nr:hypothetical protein [Mangrovimonas sp.]
MEMRKILGLIICMLVLTGCKDEDFAILDADGKINHVVRKDDKSSTYTTNALNIKVEGLATYENHETAINDIVLTLSTDLWTKADFINGVGVGSSVRTETLPIECTQVFDTIIGEKKTIVKIDDLEKYREMIRELVKAMNIEIKDYDGKDEEEKRRNKKTKTREIGDKVQDFEGKVYVFEAESMCNSSKFFVRSKIVIPNEYIWNLRNDNVIQKDHFFYSVYIYELVNQYADPISNGKALVAYVDTMLENGVTDNPSRKDLIEIELDALPQKDYDKEYQEKSLERLKKKKGNFTPHSTRANINGAQQNLIENEISIDEDIDRIPQKER